MLFGNNAHDTSNTLPRCFTGNSLANSQMSKEFQETPRWFVQSLAGDHSSDFDTYDSSQNETQ